MACIMRTQRKNLAVTKVGQNWCTRLRRTLAVAADPSPVEGDYSAYVHRATTHPALLRFSSLVPSAATVPIVATRNNIGPILDTGGGPPSRRGRITQDLWSNALLVELFFGGTGNQRQVQNEFVESLSYTTIIPRHIEYVEHDPGRQMIGSFHPTDADFMADC